MTDFGTPSEAYFPVLIVFVQFANDPGPDCTWWPKGSEPVFLNQLIAENKTEIECYIPITQYYIFSYLNNLILLAFERCEKRYLVLRIIEVANIAHLSSEREQSF